MISFRNYKDESEIQEQLINIEKNFEDGNIEEILEGGNSKVWVTGASLFIFSRINSINTKINSTEDLGKKIDLLSEQNKWLGGFINLGIATTLGDKSVYKKTKK